MLNYDTICLSGGGVSGISQLSALNTLIKNKIINLKNIKKFVATSVGSIISLFIILNYDIDEVLKFLVDLNLNTLVDNRNIDSLLYNYGINMIDKILNIVKLFLHKKYNKYDINFKELQSKFSKSIGIVGTNITKTREEFFSIETTPDMSVIKAIEISIAVPIIFNAIKYKDCLYCDGALFNNFPINYCNKKKTLGITVHSLLENKTNNLLEYVIALYRINTKSNNLKNNFNRNNVLILNGCSNIIVVNNKIKEDLINQGYKTAMNFCKNKPFFIINQILSEIIDNI